MKIERPKILNAPESTTQETAKEPVQLEKSSLPKTDSVETKPGSFYNFDNAPKLDPSQTHINAKEVPAALIPGVPFREKAELPKTLPNGTSIDGGVGSGDFGLGKTRPGPNHMGIDLKAGGTDIRNQLNDALKLREGSGSQSEGIQVEGAGKFNLGRDWSQVSAGTTKKWGDVYNGGSHTKEQKPDGTVITTKESWSTNTKGVTSWSSTKKEEFGSGGSLTTEMKGKGGNVTEAWFTEKDEAGNVTGYSHVYNTKEGQRTDYLDADKKLQYYTVEKNGVTTKYDKEGKELAKYDKEGNEIKPDADNTTNEEEKEYVDPEGGPAVSTVLTPEALERAVNLRKSANTMPSNTEDQTPIIIDPKRVFDPLKDPLVTDKNPDMQESTNFSHDLSIKTNATGPDTGNPNDPETGGGKEPIVIDPKP